MKGAALYSGTVAHARLRPVRHRLAQRIFMGLFDLDELSEIGQHVWAFGYNRPGLISFYDADHGDRSGAPLRPQIEAALWSEGIAPDGGAIRILCMPRVLGYVFNPLSVYFCYGRDHELRAVVHEVSNTFGEKHLYVLRAAAHAGVHGRVLQECAKTFRVSPFLPMDMRYRFSIKPPGLAAKIAIVASDREGPMLMASFTGARRAFSTGAILREWLTHPAMTLQVIAGIHWEALQIWLKLKRAAPA